MNHYRETDLAECLCRRLSGAELPETGFLELQGRRTPAAVLLPLIPGERGYDVLFTRRSEHLRDHAGQVSFPGGRKEPGESSERAALREAWEEIGLEPSRVTVLGRLGPYHTGTGYRVRPIVARIDPPAVWHPDPDEVAEVFTVPLAFLTDPANHRQYETERHGRRLRYHALTWREHFIWGATAGILMQFCQVLSPTAENA